MHTSGKGTAGTVRGTGLASASGAGGKPAESRPSRAGGRIDDKRYTAHPQQELFVMVVARLVAGAVLGARFRGKARSPRRTRSEGRNPYCVPLASGSRTRCD